MGLRIKNADVERLASEVADLAHETKTETTRRALLERPARLQAHGRKSSGRKSLRKYLERNVWPLIPSGELARARTITDAIQRRGARRGTEGVVTVGEAATALL